MLTEQFIEKYKKIDSMNGLRLMTNYCTDNKNYIWREDETKVDPEEHYVIISRSNIHNTDINDRFYGKLSLGIGKDAEYDPDYDYEGYYADIDVYRQDDDESDEEFYTRCIDILKSNNLNLQDDYTVDKLYKDANGNYKCDEIYSPVIFTDKDEEE